MNTRTLPLDILSDLNDTHINIIKALEESEAEHYDKSANTTSGELEPSSPGKSISELAEDLERNSNTISERVSELEEMGLVKKNSSKHKKSSVIVRPSDDYDIIFGNRKTYMKENGIDF